MKLTAQSPPDAPASATYACTFLPARSPTRPLLSVSPPRARACVQPYPCHHAHCSQSVSPQPPPLLFSSIQSSIITKRTRRCFHCTPARTLPGPRLLPRSSPSAPLSFSNNQDEKSIVRTVWFHFLLKQATIRGKFSNAGLLETPSLMLSCHEDVNLCFVHGQPYFGPYLDDYDMLDSAVQADTAELLHCTH